MTAIQITLGVIMAFVTIMQVTVLIAFRSGRFTGVVAASEIGIERRVASIEQRLDHASEKSSELTSRVQEIIGRLDRLPEDLRTTFVSRESAKILIDEWLRTRSHL